MNYDFNEIIDRRHSDSEKWRAYGEDVLPLWVADMDFRTPEPVVRALHERVSHGIFGYGTEPSRLRKVIAERLECRYGWPVSPEALLFLPGVVTGFNLACQAVAVPGDSILAQTPVYSPMLDAPANAGLTRNEMALTRGPDGQYFIDYDLFEAAITEHTRMFLLCNPHNPVGRVFRRDELERMAEICQRHDIVICSDEIHCDLLFPGHTHLPIATLDPEIADRTITLMAPSKTYNIAGLHCSVAIIEDGDLRRRYEAACRGLVHSVNVMGLVAALAAYEEGEPWLSECLQYLKANRDYLHQYVRARLPGIEMGLPEGTYLAWLDCRRSGISGDPQQFFLQQARVALNDGARFGQGGEGFVRLNFGCPRPILAEALHRMSQALSAIHEASA